MHFVFSNVLTENDNNRGTCYECMDMHFYYACVLKIIECFFVWVGSGDVMIF